MEDIGRVNVLETTQSLVQEGLEVCIGQGLTRSNLFIAGKSGVGGAREPRLTMA